MTYRLRCKRSLEYVIAVAATFAISTAQAAPGDLDPTFGAGGKVTVSFAAPGPDTASAIARDSAGNIYVGGNGHSTLGGGSTDFAVAKLDQAGQLVTSFGTGGKLLINVSTYFDNGTSLTIAGSYGYIAGSAGVGASRVWVVSKFDLDGQLVTSFGAGGTQVVSFGATAKSYAEAMGVDSSGNVFLAGATVTPPDVNFALAVAKLDATGVLVPAFGNGGTTVIPISGFSSTVNALALDGTGGVYLAATRSSGSASSIVVYRLGANGLVDGNFGSAGSVVVNFTSNFDQVRGLVRASNGDLYLSGTVLDFANVRRVGVAKLGAAGALASAYGTGGKATLGISGHSLEGRAMALDADGNIYVVGIDEVSSADYFATEFDSSGNVVTGFGNSGSTTIDFGKGNDFGNATMLDGNGHLYVAGSVDASSSSSHFGIARLLVAPADTIFKSGFEE